MHQDDIIVYAKIVDLISLRHQYKYMEHEGGEKVKSDEHKLLLDALKLIGISGSDRIPNYQSIFQLGPD
jgi:hypothetical protein